MDLKFTIKLHSYYIPISKINALSCLLSSSRHAHLKIRKQPWAFKQHLRISSAKNYLSKNSTKKHSALVREWIGSKFLKLSKLPANKQRNGLKCFQRAPCHRFVEDLVGGSDLLAHDAVERSLQKCVSTEYIQRNMTA